MKVQSIHDAAFAAYGHPVSGLDFTDLIATMIKVSEKPADAVIYVPGNASMEALPVAQQISEHLYGGMPVQLGYCNGHNRTLNCLEYHRGCEINVAADDVILLLAKKQDIVNGKISTDKVEAFLLPAGEAALLYETSLHYAPCTADGGDGFRVSIILPKGTNLDKPEITPLSEEDKMLWGSNKWLIAHPDAPEAAQGAYIGLDGENIIL